MAAFSLVLRMGSRARRRVGVDAAEDAGEQVAAEQNAMQHKFIAAVERLSGRGVLAVISNHHVGPDMEIELFLLQPDPDETSALPDF